MAIVLPVTDNLILFESVEMGKYSMKECAYLLWQIMHSFLVWLSLTTASGSGLSGGAGAKNVSDMIKVYSFVKASMLLQTTIPTFNYMHEQIMHIGGFYIYITASELTFWLSGRALLL